MAGTEYTLTGFENYPERQRVVFVEPLPGTRVCDVCGVVPSRSLLLPCGHVLCQVCKDQIPKGDGKCPLDGMEFAEDDIAQITFKQSHLEQLRAFCVAGGSSCSFRGKLCDLKDHLASCCGDKVRCAKCQQSVVRSVAVDHYRECSADTPPRNCVSVKGVSSAIVKIGDIKKDLEGVRVRASGENVDKDGVVNVVNSLMERLVSLERDLTHVGTDTCGEKCVPSQLGVKKIAIPSGPSRFASKLGAFITLCEFTNLFAGYEALTGSRKEYSLATNSYTLAGYTFSLQCNLEKIDDEHVTASFILFLREGVWDCMIEWPFAKKVTIIVTHLRDQAQDVRLPIHMEGRKIVKKPVGSGNCGASTATLNWMDLEVKGFFNNKTLYVNVEFE
ncbi:uncharacterized protein LOC144108244 [Amblyomma americanum]